MFKWLQEFSEASREMKWFIFSVASQMIIAMAVVLYAFLRLI